MKNIQNSQIKCSVGFKHLLGIFSLFTLFNTFIFYTFNVIVIQIQDF